MGSIEFDPLVHRVNNRVGNFVYTSWKGKNVIKRYNGKAPAFTAGQLKVQKAFKAAAFIWKSLPDKMKESWRSSVKGLPMTELNMFIKKNAAPGAQGMPGVITHGTGIQKLSGLSVKSESAGIVSIGYNASAVPASLSIILQKITDEKTSPLIIKTDINTSAGSAQVDGLESGAEYFIYIIVTDKVFADSSMMSESDGFKIKIA